MLLLGSKGIVAMYLATLLGLSLAYAVGRQVPLRSIAAMLRWLRLERADRLVQTLAQLPSDQQLNYLVQIAPTRVIPFLLHHRYLAWALAFNLPGNALIGGGGGIAVLAARHLQFRYSSSPLRLCLGSSPGEG